MSTPTLPPRSPIACLVAWSARRPLATLLIAAVVLALSLAGVARMYVSGSFVDMFGSDNAAAAAMVRIASEFRTTDELFVLATLPAPASADRTRDPDTAPLERYANRLDEAIAADPAAAGMVAHVRYFRGSAFQDFVRQVAIPAGAYYLSDQGFDRLLERLSPEGMRAQLRRGEALLAAPGPAAGAIAKAALRDPLRIAELAEPGAASALGIAGPSGPPAPPAPGDSSRLCLSSDGRTLLIRVAGQEQVGDLEFAKRFTDRISLLAAGANTEGLSIELAGGYAIAAATSRGIRRDSISSVILSVLLLQAIFVAFYRRPGAPLIIGAVAAIGIVAGFGVQGFHSPTVTPLTAVIAALLAGLGIDYGIHYLSHYQSCRASGLDSPHASAHTAANVGLPIVTNCFTSIFGFASLWPSQVRMLSDFALLGSLGLLGSLVSVFTVMPAVLALVDRRPAAAVRPPRFGQTAGLIAAHPRAGISVAITILGLSILGGAAGGWIPGIESDLSVMHPRPNPALDATNALGSRFADVGESVPVEIRARTPRSMLLAAHDAAAALDTPEARALGVRAVLGVHNLAPDPRKADERAARLAALNPDQVVASFDAAIAESAFEPDAFQAYRNWLRSLVTAPPPGLNALDKFPEIREQVFPIAPAVSREAAAPCDTLLLVQLAAPLNERAVRDQTVTGIRRLLAPVPEATLTGMSAITYDLEQATRGDLPRSIAISFTLVIAWLTLVFRRPGDVILAITPLLFAVVCTAGLMAFMDLQINAVNGVAIPLLDGIAVDAGVFLVAGSRVRARDPRGSPRAFGSTVQAILAASTTTVTGFASLLFTSTPAIRSLGLLGSVGIAASLCGALLLLLPLLCLRGERSARRGNAQP